MNAALDPRISEFATEDEAARYDSWFRAKVQEAIDSEKPRIPHEEAVARMTAMLDARKAARTSRSVG